MNQNSILFIFYALCLSCFAADSADLVENFRGAVRSISASSQQKGIVQAVQNGSSLEIYIQHIYEKMEEKGVLVNGMPDIFDSVRKDELAARAFQYAAMRLIPLKDNYPQIVKACYLNKEGLFSFESDGSRYQFKFNALDYNAVDAALSLSPRPLFYIFLSCIAQTVTRTDAQCRQPSDARDVFEPASSLRLETSHLSQMVDIVCGREGAFN